MQRDFKGIWIPKAIWLDENLTIMEKVFLVEIDSLEKNKECFAGNNYFAEFFNLKVTRTSQIINSLIKKGYIKAKYYRKGHNIVKRVLSLSCKNLLHKGVRRYPEKCKKVLNKVYEPLTQKCRDNNTINNTTNKLVNNKEEPKQKHLEFVLLTTKEHEKLIKDFGKDIINDYIYRLNNYIGSLGAKGVRKYSSHYFTIRTWLRKEQPVKKVDPMEIASKQIEERKQELAERGNKKENQL